MPRRPTTRRPLEPRRRSALVIVIVILAALGLAFAFVPAAVAPSAPTSCPYGAVILNGVEQCLPPNAS